MWQFEIIAKIFSLGYASSIPVWRVSMKRCRLFVLIVCAGLLTSLARGAQKPALVVLELAGGTELKLKDVNDPAVSYPLTVENRGSAGVKKVEVTVSSFSSASGDTASPTLSFLSPPPPGATSGPSVTLDVPGGRSVPLYLGVELPKAATYRAVVRFVSGKEILLSFPIEIVRTRAQQPVEIGDLPAVQATAAFLHRDFSHLFEATAYSTGGTVVLLPPVLHSATRKLKNDSTAGVATGLKLQTGKQVTVEAGLPQKIPFEILNFEGPGRYDATIRFPAAGYQPIEKTVTVYVRDSFWMAVLYIALGALVSLGVHAYTARIRPRLVAQQRVSAMFADLSALQTRMGEDPASRELVQRVSDNLANLWDELRRKRRAPASEDFDLFDQIVQNLRPWIELRQQLLAIRPASIRDQLMPALMDAGAAFIRAAPAATEVQTSVKALEDLPAKISAAIQSEIRSQVVQLETELRGNSRAEGMLNRLPQVLNLLDSKDVKAALTAFNRIRGDYVRLVANDLRSLTTPMDPPAGVIPEKWKEVQTATIEVVQDLNQIGDPDKEMQAFRAVLKSYLTVVLEGLGRFSSNLSKGDHEAVGKKLMTIQADIKAGKLTVAWRALEATEKEISLKLGAGKMGGAEAAATAALKAAVAPSAVFGALDLIDIVDAAPPSEVLRHSGATAAAERRIGIFDVLLTFIVILVAVAIGLQTLWADNPTWGGWLSYLAAFVWGFALDQFTHAGVLALRPAR
jgi:hypothetical protein